MLEDGAYRRLLDAYYIREAPLPLATREVFRLVRAQSKQDREAVETVLREFFTESPDGWRHGRCDREISTYQETIPDREAKRENDRERQRRARERRKALFEALRGHGIVPAYDATTGELEAMLSRASKRDGHGAVTQPVTRDNTVTHTPDTRNQRDTPIPPSGAVTGKEPESRKTTAIGLKAWLESAKAKGEKPIPPDDAVFAYADSAGIPAEFLALAWCEFKHRYCQPDAKRYRDWRSVFRKAVRGNWLKLWFVQPDGAYALTTVGIQAQRTHDDRKAA